MLNKLDQQSFSETADSDHSDEGKEQGGVSNLMRTFQINLAQITAVKGDKYQNNTVKTCKYSILTFLPLNLLV